MANWPKKHLLNVDKVHIEQGEFVWELDGETFVQCLEAGGWVDAIDPIRGAQQIRDEAYMHGFLVAVVEAKKAVESIPFIDSTKPSPCSHRSDGKICWSCEYGRRNH